MKHGLKQTLATLVAGEAARSPATLRSAIRNDDSPEMRLRRATVGTSIIGMASMIPVILFQTGIIRHLPDPPMKGFHSDKVNSSDTAFGYGGPDGPISLAAHATNLVLAALGGPGRTKERPWLPLLATGLAGGQTAVAAKYLFYQMPRVDKAWCPYCITDAVMHMATFAFTLPGAVRALMSLRGNSGR